MVANLSRMAARTCAAGLSVTVDNLQNSRISASYTTRMRRLGPVGGLQLHLPH
ncbi:MAG: hypothetical protein ACI8QZ_003323 [Chlamydiales bacterium]|jgi:hypothetical protein